MMKIAGQKGTGNLLPFGDEDGGDLHFEANNVIKLSGSYNFFVIPIENMTVSGNYNHVSESR